MKAFFAQFLGAYLLIMPLANAGDGLRLYTLDCGQVDVADANIFSDTQGYDGRTLDLPVPCYVIKHGTQALLWDAGVPAGIAQAGNEGVEFSWYTVRLSETLEPQLKAIDLEPDDINYIGISHVHFDHMAQAQAVANAHLLIGRADFEFLFSGTADPGGFNPAFLEGWKNSDNKTLISGDHDVFGDGRVMMLSAPGHTPGHMALLVYLENEGPVILSGDLYHFAENRLHRRMPDFNTSRADTLASMDRIEAYAKAVGARLIIQHDRPTYDAMPKGKAFLD